LVALAMERFNGTPNSASMVSSRSGDRQGRSLKDLVAFLSELYVLGSDLFLHQQGLDTTTPAGKAMFQMLGVFAEFEHSIIESTSALASSGPSVKVSDVAGRRSRPRWLSESGRPWRAA
jgi:hypothetical protein